MTDETNDVLRNELDPIFENSISLIRGGRPIKIPEKFKTKTAFVLILAYGNDLGEIVEFAFIDADNDKEIAKEKDWYMHFFKKVEVRRFWKRFIAGSWVYGC